MEKKRVAFVVSGAAALIAQELALSKVLIEGLNHDWPSVRPDVIAGASSGSLSAIALNAVLQTLDGQRGDRPPLTFDVLEKDLLFPLTDNDAFTTGFFADIGRFFNAAFNGFVLNTEPLKKTLERYVRGPQFINYKTLGDTYLPTYISAVNRATGVTKRFYSKNLEDAQHDLVQVLLASSAIPVVFTERNVHGAGTVVDGGAGPDNVPVEALRDQKFDELYVITHQHPGDKANHKKRHRFKHGLVSNATFALDVSTNAIFPFQLFRAMSLVHEPGNAYLYMPTLKTDFSFLNFGTMKAQFTESLAWAKANPPQRIQDYLKETGFLNPFLKMAPSLMSLQKP